MGERHKGPSVDTPDICHMQWRQLLSYPISHVSRVSLLTKTVKKHDNRVKRDRCMLGGSDPVNTSDEGAYKGAYKKVRRIGEGATGRSF